MNTITTDTLSVKLKRIFNPLASRLNSVAPTSQHFTEWKSWEKSLFRFFFIFFIILVVPLDWKFYRDLFSINWLHLHFYDLFKLSRYQPQFILQSELPRWGIGSFANWGIAALIALVGAVIWAKRDKRSKEYTVLYYWLRVIIRYRLAVTLIAYGFIKLFPLQMPYPSLSNLYTNYGDFFAWKIYFQTVAIAPKYEAFLGFVEILAGFLLFNRRTVTFGAGLIIGFLGNVAVANGFYDIGEHIFSTFIVLLAAFLLVYDVPRLYNLLISEQRTSANRFVPVFANAKGKNLRRVLRSVFILYVLVFGYKSYASSVQHSYKIPQAPGLSNAYGYYDVRTFIINNDTIPYSLTDPSRWQNVIFEKWSTLSIKVNRPVKIDFSSGDGVHENDIDRNYELAGLAGRHYFYYEADTVRQTLLLQNKNKNHRDEKLSLIYIQPNDSTIVISGINENGDTIYAVLDRVEKKYMMYEGRRKPVKL